MMKTYELLQYVTDLLQLMEDQCSRTGHVFNKTEVMTDITVRNGRTVLEITMPVYRSDAHAGDLYSHAGDLYSFIEYTDNDGFVVGDVILDSTLPDD